jgi:flavin reductase (DIM6/NTAB) family NADH-FMN oxidoreductase RutF
MIIKVELAKCCRMLNPGPTILVSSRKDENSNVMAAAWNTTIDFSPPKVAVVIAEGTYTRELVDQTGEFVVNIPTRQLAQATLDVGHISGRDVNKFERYKLETFPGEKVAAPLVKGCMGWLECRVIPEPHIQKTYDLFIAEVVAAWADDRCFEDGRWKLPPRELQSLHYIAGGNYLVGSEMVSFELPE